MRPKLGSRLQSVSGSPLAPFTALPWASRLAVVFLVLLAILAVFAPLIAPHGPLTTGTCSSASRSATRCASVPWIMTARRPNSFAMRRAVKISSARCAWKCASALPQSSGSSASSLLS